ncbi:MAG: hypothetical protein HYR85_22535 [Planctomycetes bacterium]|nr:hypothetical protein [Planctomycetota bacterium]MBI3844841.1 hypothetical protein [Planctomycetota bacterium]
MEATRVGIDELKDLMDRGEPRTVIDVRNPKAWKESQVKIPRAIRIPLDQIEQRLDEIPRDQEIITYCT